MPLIVQKNLSYLLCFLLGALCSLAIIIFPPSALLPHLNARSLERKEPGTSASSTPELVQSGAGEIESSRIFFGNSDGVFPDREQRLQAEKWFFQGFCSNELAQFLDTCELRRAEKKCLFDAEYWTVRSNGCQLAPPPQLIWSLAPHSRSKIYSLLSRSEENYPQQLPFRFGLHGFDSVFKESDLPKSQIERIRSLTYTNGDSLCFADLQAVAREFPPAQFNDLIQTLCSVPAYLLRLHIKPDTDVNALVKYWGKGERERLIAPLLGSLGRVPGGGWVNVSYLLPPFARLHLYTYPDAWQDPSAEREDCIYTALNFFNDRPITNYLDQTCRSQALANDYFSVTNEPVFGDLVVLLDGDGNVCHACVYIAEGFVFTKNGVNRAQPWVLMKMGDMLGLYRHLEKSGRIAFLRRKTPATLQAKN